MSCDMPPTWPSSIPRPVHGILVESYHFEEKADEEDMLSNLSSISPLSVGVNAVSWQDYIGRGWVGVAGDV